MQRPHTCAEQEQRAQCLQCILVLRRYSLDALKVPARASRCKAPCGTRYTGLDWRLVSQPSALSEARLLVCPEELHLVRVRLDGSVNGNDAARKRHAASVLAVQDGVSCTEVRARAPVRLDRRRRSCSSRHGGNGAGDGGCLLIFVMTWRTSSPPLRSTKASMSIAARALDARSSRPALLAS
jgi:hypothetical protein